MQYRTFGRLDWKPSALGFGIMRLPTIGDDPGRIDEPEATVMVRHAIDQGVNYLDTAYSYHREASESFVGRLLQDGYRDRVRLATKMPTWLIEKRDDFDRYLAEQLERLQADYIDFYLLHTLNEKHWAKLPGLGLFRWAEGAMADGRIRHLGFSFHDKYELFQEIVDATDLWSMCQIQYNFMDVEYQAGTRGLKYAAGKGLAVVVMEPLRGGMLTRNIPPAVQAIWDSAGAIPPSRSGPRAATGPDQRTPADLALRWLWDQPEVSVVLSGMSTLEQVQQNLASAERSGPGTLAAEERDVLVRVRAVYEELCPIPCSDCRYCMPCPSGVNIPRVFEIYNNARMYGDAERGRMSYSWMPEDERANLCVECGECLEKCPQGIEIPEWLKKAHEVLCQ